ncbi:haloacid dehalogenase [Pedobacter sp. SL55]|uniref:haloacid dehalogenase n=1 Tax=Pedobacter sp. SL55 TaxID=2995161 RepID=UPI00227173FD|nr:haloacid dehalogenase [Pedobacter sp. SL55]WAC40300.1 haloacid dehalogenase [Pedobacter sp. SL55]
MSFEKYLSNKKALIITLDDALYPKKDYLLQVYYLFSEFMAYTEQIDAKAIVNFMSKEFTENGELGLFKKTAAKFDIPEKYEQNFNLLFETARLPLKLLLFKNVLNLLQEVVVDRRTISILVEGNPAEAINKMKQIEWNGLEPYLKVYFTVEYSGSASETIKHILTEQGFEKEDVVLFVSENQAASNFVDLAIDNFSVTEIL